MTHVAVTPTSGHRVTLGVVQPLHPPRWTVVVTGCSELRQILGFNSRFLQRHYDSHGGNAHFRSQDHLGGGSTSLPPRWTVVVTCCSELQQNVCFNSRFNRDTMTHVAVTPTSGHRVTLGVVQPLHLPRWTVVVTGCSELRQILGFNSRF